eukprot:jgi/Ulvmu1/10487/UM064_0024.1
MQLGATPAWKEILRLSNKRMILRLSIKLVGDLLATSSPATKSCYRPSMQSHRRVGKKKIYDDISRPAQVPFMSLSRSCAQCMVRPSLAHRGPCTRPATGCCRH